MANWSEIKPLRIHSNFLTFLLAGLISLLLLLPSKSKLIASKQSLKTEVTVTVNAYSGVKLREESSLVSNVLATVPYNAVLRLIDSTNLPSGKWLKVEYNGITGFVWRKYITE